MKYSIIIPAYNAETTPGRCLDSLVTQLPGDSELLLINDGSCDGTAEICRSYAERYPQIRFFSKTNGGVSSARNEGLDHAAGDYVLFVDADDAVRSDYFERLDETLRDAPDLLLFRKQLLGKAAPRPSNRERSLSCTGHEQSCRVVTDYLRRQELNLITTKAFRREIIEEHGLRFDKRLDIGEDKVFAFAFSLLADTIKTSPLPLYFLSVDDPNSLSRRRRDHLCRSVLLEHDLLFSITEDSRLPAAIKKKYRQAVSYSFHRSAYSVITELRKFDLSRKERLAKTREILTAYAKRDDTLYDGLSHFLFAIPIRLRMTRVVDSIVSLEKGIGVLP